MLDKDDLESLNLFNEKAEKLKSHNFTKKIINDGFGITISSKEDEPVNIETRFRLSYNVSHINTCRKLSKLRLKKWNCLSFLYISHFLI